MALSDVVVLVMGSFGQIHPMPGARCDLPVQLMFPMAAAQAYATSASLQYAMPMTLLPGHQFPRNVPFGIGVSSTQQLLLTLPGGKPFLPSDRVMPASPMHMNTCNFSNSTDGSALDISAREMRVSASVASADRSTGRARRLRFRCARVVCRRTCESQVAHLQLAAQRAGQTLAKSRGPAGVTWLSLRGGYSTQKPGAGHLV